MEYHQSDNEPRVCTGLSFECCGVSRGRFRINYWDQQLKELSFNLLNRERVPLPLPVLQ